MTLNTLLYLAIMIFAGLLFSKLVRKLRLPNVTGYLLAGLLIGPCILNVLPQDALPELELISEVALGFIAFSIGNEFKIYYFKRVGITPIVIACMESLFAVLAVLGVMLLTGHELAFSLVLSSIAAATAPAATIMVIDQYRARGPVTETLLSVVAIDDATALILFGIFAALAKTLMSNTKESLLLAVLTPLLETCGALIIGSAMGLALTWVSRLFPNSKNLLSLTIAFVLAGTGIADKIGVSALLLCMAMGAALTNFSSRAAQLNQMVDGLTPPIYMLFFVLSGAELQLSALRAMTGIGAIYLVMRVLGKMAGAAAGARLCRAEKTVQRYLGLGLLPQAGVAIGLSMLTEKIVPAYSEQISAVVLCSTMIYELIGPAVTKAALIRAGEIRPEESEPATVKATEAEPVPAGSTAPK